MSRFSGKCDLCDLISGMGGWYDCDGNPVKFGEGCGAYYSDEYQDFLAFKKATGGMLHQSLHVKIPEWNAEELTQLCPELEVFKHERVVKDKRYKAGERKETYYTYKYYGKEYTLQEINKEGIWVTIDIPFDTILDLVPYYPYLVSTCCCSDGKYTIYISSRSFVDQERDEHLSLGIVSNFWQHYKKELQDHYRDLVLEHFDPRGREHVEEVVFGDDLLGRVSKPIDENFDPEWRWADGQVHSHWTSPKIEDAANGVIRISETDAKMFNNRLLVYYVEPKQEVLKLC